MYEYKKYVFVLIIILLCGLNFTLLAQDLAIRVTDMPIPGGPLHKGGVEKIESASAELTNIPVNAGMMEPAESDATDTQLKMIMNINIPSPGGRRSRVRI